MSKHAQVAREVKIDCFVFRIQGIALHIFFLGLLFFLHLRSFDQPQMLLPKMPKIDTLDALDDEMTSILYTL